MKNERNVTKFGYVFVPKFHIVHKSFPGDLTNEHGWILNFLKNSILKDVKKIENIHMNSEKSINSFEIKKRTSYLIMYQTIILFTNLSITFWHYYDAKWMFLTSLMSDINFFFYYITKYWNSDRFKLLVGNLRSIQPQGGCTVTFLTKSGIQKVFWILPDETKTFENSCVQKVLRMLIPQIIQQKNW